MWGGGWWNRDSGKREKFAMTIRPNGVLPVVRLTKSCPTFKGMMAQRDSARLGVKMVGIGWHTRDA